MQKKRLPYASVTSLPFLPCAVKGILAVNLPAKGKQRFSHKPLANVNLRRRRLIPSMDKRRKERGRGGGGSPSPPSAPCVLKQASILSMRGAGGVLYRERG